MNKRLYRIMAGWLSLALAAAGLVASCEYPFNIDIEESSRFVVIEASIQAGERSVARVNYSSGISATLPAVDVREIYLECENGTRIPGVQNTDKNGIYYSLATERLGLGERCRLYVRAMKALSTLPPSWSDEYIPDESGKTEEVEYLSDWVEVLKSPEIENLSYVIDEMKTQMSFMVTTKPEQGFEGYCKWNYDETWEYTANFKVKERYDPLNQSIVIGTYDRYYCWNTAKSTSLMVGSSKDLEGGRFKDHVFTKIASTDQRISYIYRMDLYQTAISRQAYTYYETLKKNSEQTGGLFGEMPTDMTGNITCLTHPEERVIGYVTASTVSKARIEVFNSETDFYDFSLEPRCDRFEFTPDEYLDRFVAGYDVLTIVEDEFGNKTVYWSQARCVNCLVLGGNKNRPADWPTQDI